MSFFGGRRSQTPPEPQPEAQPADRQPAGERINHSAPVRDTRETPIPAMPHPVGFDTVIGTGCTIEGNLSSTGNVRLDGTFTGSLDIQGNVLVGETAKIMADLHAKNISIAGAVHGNVSGKKVQLLRTGRVWGDISATALSTEEGAFIDGKISMISREEARPLTEPTRPEDARLDADPPVAAEPDFMTGGETPGPDADDEAGPVADGGDDTDSDDRIG